MQKDNWDDFSLVKMRGGVKERIKISLDEDTTLRRDRRNLNSLILLCFAPSTEENKLTNTEKANIIRRKWKLMTDNCGKFALLNQITSLEPNKYFW